MILMIIFPYGVHENMNGTSQYLFFLPEAVVLNHL